MRYSWAISRTAVKIFLCKAPVRGGLGDVVGRDSLSYPPHSLIASSAPRQRLHWQASSDAALDLQAASDRLVVVPRAAPTIDNEPGLDATLNLQTTRHCLIVIATEMNDDASFDAALDLQTASHCLVVIHTTAFFHVRLDFHSYLLLLVSV